ncbi:MAG: hypothetical protein IJQ28_04605, partial [Clostridia bacterium]|nr:hypothetical protein [Clostridia bacterium]
MLMGRGMLNGIVPYRDLVDNKGLVIYALNALAQFIFPYKIFSTFGVWFMLFVFMFVSLVLVWKIAKLLGCKYPVLFQIIYMFLIFGLYRGGNRCEEYSTFFTVIAYYFAVKYIKAEGEKSIWKYGAIFGLT